MVIDDSWGGCWTAVNWRSTQWLTGSQSWLRKKQSRVVDNGRWLMVMMAETWGLWASQPRLMRGNKDKPPFLSNFSLITGHVLLSNILGCMKYTPKKKKKQRHLSKKSLYLYNQINKYRPTFAFTLKTDMKNWLKVRWKNWHLYFSLKIWVNSEFKFRIHLSFERPNLWH